MTALPTVGDHVVHERTGDELVLVHLKTNQIYVLNESAARFWELLAAGGSRDEIKATMVAEFDVAPELLDGDIQRLLADLAVAGLVEPV